MAITALDVSGIALRIAGIFVFVTVTVPFGFFQAVTFPDQMTSSSIPLIVIAILVACIHVYFMYRAYYALRLLGILVFSAVYALLLYYFLVLFGLDPGAGTIRWAAVVYLTLLYGYGVAYNSVDAFISGLLHTKSV